MQDQDQKDCQQISELLSAFLDMELSLEEVEMVENHLTGCEKCKQDLAAIEMVVDKLKSLPEIPARDFAEAIEARIMAAPAAPKEQEQKPALVALPDNVRTIAPASSKGSVKAFGRVKALAAVAAVALFGLVAAANMVPRPAADLAQTPRSVVVASHAPNSRLESDKGGAPLNDDIVALYDEEGGNSVSDAGISTNEDGLYAIKM